MAAGTEGTVIASLVVDANGQATATPGRNTFIENVSGDIYVICYTTNISATWYIGIATVDVSDDGATLSTVDTATIAGLLDGDIDFTYLDGDVYVVAYRYTGGKMYIASIVIESDGTIGATATQEVGVNDSHYPVICAVGTGYIVVGYQHNADSGTNWLKTFAVGSDGAITGSAADTESFIVGALKYTAFVEPIRDSVYAFGYEDSSADTIFKTYTISSSTGAISSVLDTENMDTATGGSTTNPRLISAVAGVTGLCLVTYTAPANTGRFLTLSIAANGTIGSPIDTLDAIHGSARKNQVALKVSGGYAVTYIEDDDDWGIVEVIIVNSSGLITHVGYVEVHETTTVSLCVGVTGSGHLIVPYILSTLKVATMSSAGLIEETDDRVTGIVIREGPGYFSSELHLGGLSTSWRLVDLQKEPTPAIPAEATPGPMVSTGPFWYIPEDPNLVPPADRAGYWFWIINGEISRTPPWEL